MGKYPLIILTVGVLAGATAVLISSRSSALPPAHVPTHASMPSAQRPEPAPQPAIARAAPRLRTFLKKSAPLEVRVQGLETLIYPLTDADIEAIAGTLRDASENDTIRNIAADLLQHTAAPRLTGDLIGILDNTSERPRFRGYAAQHLGERLGPTFEDSQHQEIVDRLHGALTDSERSVRREALLALFHIQNAEALATVAAGFDDPAWAQDQDLIIRCVVEQDHRDLIPRIRTLVSDTLIPIRVAALWALGHWRDQASRDVFERAKSSPILAVRQAGELALRSLDPPPVATAAMPAEAPSPSDPAAGLFDPKPQPPTRCCGQ